VSLLAAALACGAALVSAAEPAPVVVQLQAYEQEIAAQPENLAVAADYRQAAVAARMFDRPVDFLGKLAKRKGSGPNIAISYALACVDKIPIAGDVRRAHLGFDAMDVLTRAIAQDPSVLAYYVRGRINLGYDKLIFHRADKGAADLSHALALVTDDTPRVLAALVYVSLGDAYYKLDQQAKAHDTWAAGASKYPDDVELRSRLDTTGVALHNMVNHALSPGTRADTSLVGVVNRR
jgi:hypothetical protein